MQAEKDVNGYHVVLIPHDDKAVIGTRARERRLRLKQTPTETARRLGVAPQTLRRWENGGVSAKMWQHKLNAWAAALNTSPAWLLDGVTTVVQQATHRAPPYAADRSPDSVALTPQQRIEIGEHAAARRRGLGMSFIQVAAAVGTRWQTIQNWETGKLPRHVDASSFAAWEEALSVPHGWLKRGQGAAAAADRNGSIEVRFPADDFYEAVRTIGIVLAKPAFDPFWHSTALDAKQSRLATLFARRFGDAQNPLSDMRTIAADFQISRRHATQLVDAMCVRAARYVFVVSMNTSGHSQETRFIVDSARGVAVMNGPSSSVE
ncbi:helix-turn-helix transcriptional regulator [Paraburkholderia sp. J67]|uniref:helix-turn-helix domain-containing protein n=1 Tax=Paraburkholderia sp. J67 TaxID=2805435 RepID=UPI002ABDF450|nr:helix-turn-helix transcriptional regulator [Paraburkholderia sp. J67]